MNLKIKNIYFSIFSVIILCMVTLSGLKAQTPAGDKAGAKAFVQKFYDWYVPLYNKSINEHLVRASMAALEQKSSYFDEALRKALLDDAAAQAKSHDEIVGLDADPFLAAQDNVLGYKLGEVKQVGNKFWVVVDATRVIAEVMKTGGSWKITNIIYPANDKFKQYDLLQELNDLRKSREKRKGK